MKKIDNSLEYIPDMKSNIDTVLNQFNFCYDFWNNHLMEWSISLMETRWYFQATRSKLNYIIETIRNMFNQIKQVSVMFIEIQKSQKATPWWLTK
jgi:hypothetical protein